MLICPFDLILCCLNKTDNCCFALQVNVGEESQGKEEHLATVEVQVESASLAAVCGLHHAVLRRLQVQTHTPCHNLYVISRNLQLQTSADIFVILNTDIMDVF